ncbi:MAG: pectic acid lyase [Planctomycetaceae bacterium]|nr:pectic acid lyase [Planctomycetaceae bacterium]
MMTRTPKCQHTAQLCRLIATVALLVGCLGPSFAQEAPTAADATEGMKKAAVYFRQNVAVHGGYVYEVSEDLKTRFGEGEALPSEIWVQPPGTPSVGMAFLQAWKATAEAEFLSGAQEAARALCHGQLESGGWTDRVNFDPKGKTTGHYRSGRGNPKGRDVSTLDDDKTQSALCFLMEMDQALEFKDAEIHDACVVALDSLLKAQFANGGFPQGWSGPVEPGPVVKASFPDYDWKTEGRHKDYWNYETLNDGLAGTVTRTLHLAHQVYGEPRYKDSLLKFGDFLIRAQLPEPQPAWAQQYNHQLQPIWARRFEPPAVAGRESEDAIETLLFLTEVTGEKRFLEPIPAALAWIRRSMLPDGQIARFYELRTNTPLYFRREGDNYLLTYNDDDLPGHYSFRSRSRLQKLEQRYEEVSQGKVIEPKPQSLKLLQKDAAAILGKLDDQGRWLSPTTGKKPNGSGTLWIRSDEFSKNVTLLSDYVTRLQQTTDLKSP